MSCFKDKMQKIDISGSSAPDLAGGAYSASLDFLS